MHATMGHLSWAALALAVATAAPAIAQDVAPEHTATVARIMASQDFKTLVGALQTDHERWVEEVVKLTEIPAPPFKEQVRAKAYMEMLKALGLSEVEIDAEGNAMGVRKGTGGGPLVVVYAQVDTVLSETRVVTDKRARGTRRAAGVGGGR